MEQKFTKDGVVRYAYNEAEAVRLRGQGWAELEDAKSEKAAKAKASIESARDQVASASSEGEADEAEVAVDDAEKAVRKVERAKGRDS